MVKIVIEGEAGTFDARTFVNNNLLVTRGTTPSNVLYALIKLVQEQEKVDLLLEGFVLLPASKEHSHSGGDEFKFIIMELDRTIYTAWYHTEDVGLTQGHGITAMDAFMDVRNSYLLMSDEDILESDLMITHISPSEQNEGEIEITV
jgi:hypothetical protein